MLWASDHVYCIGRYMVAANWDREGWTLTFIHDFDREFEPDCWEWRLGGSSGFPRFCIVHRRKESRKRNLYFNQIRIFPAQTRGFSTVKSGWTAAFLI